MTTYFSSVAQKKRNNGYLTNEASMNGVCVIEVISQQGPGRTVKVETTRVSRLVVSWRDGGLSETGAVKS